MTHHLSIDLPPTRWMRPVRTKWGTFNPHQKKLDFIKALLKKMWKRDPLNGCLFVKMVFVMPIALSLTPKKRSALVNQYHCKDPDIDNLQKFYLDVMSGIVCLDDCQFSHVEALKVYGEKPRVDIMLSKLDAKIVAQEYLENMMLFDQSQRVETGARAAFSSDSFVDSDQSGGM